MKSKLNNRLTNIFILIISVCVSISSLASFPALAQDEQPDSAIVAPAAMAQQQALVANDGAANDLFGCAVAIDGNTAVVGAHKDRAASGIKPGAAYVYVRSGSAWTLEQKLTPDANEDGDRFGFRVAINGNTIVVGAPTDDIGTHSGQGSAYVFTRANGIWSLQQKLTASDGDASDDFGGAVAIQGDTIAVGAYGDTIGGNQSQGSAYLFTRANGVWTQQQKLTASDAQANDIFGNSVALSNDTLLVGAEYDDIGATKDQGSVYVFTRSGNIWSESQKLTANDGIASAGFSRSLSISGDTLVIGSPFSKQSNPPTIGSAYVFKRTNGTWSQQQKLIGDDSGDNEGFGISVSVNGGRITIGASSFKVGANSGQGAVFVFAQANGAWTQAQKLLSDDGATEDRFGYAVAASGNTIVVGAVFRVVENKVDQGAAYIFNDPSDKGTPKIQNVQVKGKKLIVTGVNFEAPSFIYLNGEKQKKCVNDEASPTTVVIGLKAGKLIAPGATISVQVKNNETGETSDEFIFTRPND